MKHGNVKRSKSRPFGRQPYKRNGRRQQEKEKGRKFKNRTKPAKNRHNSYTKPRHATAPSHFRHTASMPAIKSPSLPRSLTPATGGLKLARRNGSPCRCEPGKSKWPLDASTVKGQVEPGSRRLTKGAAAGVGEEVVWACDGGRGDVVVEDRGAELACEWFCEVRWEEGLEGRGEGVCGRDCGIEGRRERDGFGAGWACGKEEVDLLGMEKGRCGDEADEAEDDGGGGW
ncbi:hypothetical protein IWZ01DRAFT_504242 [Phyllosticta capitalensis]